MWNPWMSLPIGWSGLQTEVGAVDAETVRQRWQLPDSRYLHIDGMTVHYRDSAPASEQPVLLLLHGLMASLHTWQQWTNQLRTDFRVISLDLPNFGLTGPHPKGMVKHLYSDFLDRFLGQLNIPGCHVAGNSLGGWMGWELAARFPQRVRRLVLIDSAGFFFVPPGFLMNLAMPGGGWLYSRSAIPVSATRDLLAQIYHDPSQLTDDRIALYHDLLMREGNRVAAARVLRYIRDQLGFNTHLLADVKQPVLLLWGADDPWLPLQHVTEFEHYLEDVRSIIYPQCGHLPMEEQPLQSASDCRAFLLQD